MASEMRGRLLRTISSRLSTCPCRQRLSPLGSSQPMPSRTSMGLTNFCAASAASAALVTRSDKLLLIVRMHDVTARAGCSSTWKLLAGEPVLGCAGIVAIRRRGVTLFLAFMESAPANPDRKPDRANGLARMGIPDALSLDKRGTVLDTERHQHGQRPTRSISAVRWSSASASIGPPHTVSVSGISRRFARG